MERGYQAQHPSKCCRSELQQLHIPALYIPHTEGNLWPYRPVILKKTGMLESQLQPRQRLPQVMPGSHLKLKGLAQRPPSPEVIG